MSTTPEENIATPSEPSPAAGQLAPPQVDAVVAPANRESMLPLILASLALVTSLCVAFYVVRYMPSASKAEIYVVDMPALVEMRMNEMVSETPDSIRQKSAEFTKALDDEIARLTKSGAVLLAPDAVVAGRDAIDATDMVAKSVGVTTSYESYIKQKASARAQYNQQLASQLRTDSGAAGLTKANPNALLRAPNPTTTNSENQHASQPAPNLD